MYVVVLVEHKEAKELLLCVWDMILHTLKYAYVLDYFPYGS
jgi:hypothetical protein